MTQKTLYLNGEKVNAFEVCNVYYIKTGEVRKPRKGDFYLVKTPCLAVRYALSSNIRSSYEILMQVKIQMLPTVTEVFTGNSWTPSKVLEA